MNNLLLFIPSPRNIPQFLESTSKLRFDKLWLKYYPEIDAYTKGREFFLDAQKDYTHFMILPDDLLVMQQDIDLLLKDLEAYPNIKVINGWCRNTIRQRDDWGGIPETEETAASNVSHKLPPDPPFTGTYSQYEFIPISSIVTMLTQMSRASATPVMPIKYAGFPPTIIAREVIEKVPFRRQHCCVDSCFSLDLAKQNISQYCDFRVRTTHLNIHDREILVGERPPEMVFERRT